MIWFLLSMVGIFVLIFFASEALDILFGEDDK